MELKLSGSHRATYDAVFQHPVARNLKWVDVRELLVALADSFDERGDLLKLTRNGKSLSLHRPTRSGMGDIAELMKVRHFLQGSTTAVPQPIPDGAHVLVVIDHRSARIYQGDLHGTVPQRIVPDDPSGSDKHLHYVEDDATGQRKPEQKSFYEAIAKAIQRSQRIVVFGSGTGASSAMDHLLAELTEHHKDLAGRIVGSAVVDEHHLTDDQLLAKAREVLRKTETTVINSQGNREAELVLDSLRQEGFSDKQISFAIQEDDAVADGTNGSAIEDRSIS